MSKKNPPPYSVGVGIGTLTSSSSSSSGNTNMDTNMNNKNGNGNGNENGSTTITTSTSSSTTKSTLSSRSFTVLYYKRKNKVHKSKGVSKMDGYLTVFGPPKSLIILSEDVVVDGEDGDNGNNGNHKTIVFKGIQREIANQMDGLNVDDIIQIGGLYDVEIVSIIKNHNNNNSSRNNNNNNNNHRTNHHSTLSSSSSSVEIATPGVACAAVARGTTNTDTNTNANGNRKTIKSNHVAGLKQTTATATTISTSSTSTSTSTPRMAALASRSISKFRSPGTCNRNLFRPVVANKPSTIIPKRTCTPTPNNNNNNNINNNNLNTKYYKKPPAQPPKKVTPPKEQKFQSFSSPSAVAVAVAVAASGNIHPSFGNDDTIGNNNHNNCNYKKNNNNDDDDDDDNDDNNSNKIIIPQPLKSNLLRRSIRKRPFAPTKTSATLLLSSNKHPRTNSAFQTCGRAITTNTTDATDTSNGCSASAFTTASAMAVATFTSTSTSTDITNDTMPGQSTTSTALAPPPAKTGLKSTKLTSSLPPPISSSSIVSTSTSTLASTARSRLKSKSIPTSSSRSSTMQEEFFPGVISGKIDIPHSIKTVLKPHQIEGIAFLWNCLLGNTNAAKVSPHSDVNAIYKGAILADEMGLGKTLMTIAVICALHRRNRTMRYVVVCPSSLVTNWGKEFDKWLGKASCPKRVVVKKGGEEGLSRLKAFCAVKSGQDAEVLIISYDLFRINSSLFHDVKKIALLVVDEGHRLKNTAGSLTMTALESIPSEARLCITATPIQNILCDFYNIANFVCPGLLGDLATFRREYERPISTLNNKTCTAEQRQRGEEQSRILDDIIKTFMIRRLQKDILKVLLPPRTEVLVFCRPTNVQCDLYREITQHYQQQSPGVGATTATGATAEALTTLINLRKLCCHPSLVVEKNGAGSSTNHVGESSSGDGIAASGKLKALDLLLTNMRKETPQDKVIIVSNFTSALSTIEEMILKPKQLSYVRLDGSTEVTTRHQLVDTFNKTSSKRTFAFLLSSKAGGCGLNLIGANRLVMFDPDWNPASDVQAMARIYRQGQTKPCTIYRLFTTGTVEEVICQRQIQKGNLATLAVDTAGANSDKMTSKGFTKEELRDCFTLKVGCDCDTKAKMGNHWPAYDGASSIELQGCDDIPLLSTVSDGKASPISFVHVVVPKNTDGDDDPALPASGEVSENDNDDDEDSVGNNDNNRNEEEEEESSEDENCWTDDNNGEDGADDANKMEEDSDEENEF